MLSKEIVHYYLCKAKDLDKEEKFKESFSLYQFLADAGDSAGLRETGIAYMYGRGTEQDFQKAFENLKAAYEKNDLEAPFRLAKLCSDPDVHGTMPWATAENALHFLTKAAEMGHYRAMRKLGSIYAVPDKNYGITAISNHLADYWLTKGLSRGMAYATPQELYCLSKACDATGQAERALFYLSHAAERNHRPSMFKLVSIYLTCKTNQVLSGESIAKADNYLSMAIDSAYKEAQEHRHSKDKYDRFVIWLCLTDLEYIKKSYQWLDENCTNRVAPDYFRFRISQLDMYIRELKNIPS